MQGVVVAVAREEAEDTEVVIKEDVQSSMRCDDSAIQGARRHTGEGMCCLLCKAS